MLLSRVLTRLCFTTKHPRISAVLPARSLHPGVCLRQEESLVAGGHEGDEVDQLLANHFMEGEFVRPQKLIEQTERMGISLSDPRFTLTNSKIKKIMRENPGGVCSLEEFKDAISDSLPLILRIIQGKVVIPRFAQFSEKIKTIYEEEKLNEEGKVADYIPQLSKYSPDYWGVAVTTIDGQRLSLGDTKVNFALQSSVKPYMYAVAITEESPQYVNNFFGYEPSGLDFNEIVLDEDNKPHNPLINAGAIVVASLIRPDLPLPDRTVHMLDVMSKLTGGDKIGIDLPTFLSERENADRNYAIAHYINDHSCFPKGTNLRAACDLYFQFCSVMMNARQGSVLAASLAKGGVCPLTGERVFDDSAVRDALSIMHSCGMYNYSGTYAFEVGLPSKSGVSGIILTVIPNVMGICTWSPPVDIRGNSVRGVQFHRKLVQRFNFHNFDLVMDDYVSHGGLDPRMRIFSKDHQITSVLFAALKGDLKLMHMYAFSGYNFDSADYDGRTALHIAAAEGQLDVCRFLIDRCKVQLGPKDRWGQTPLSEAVRSEQQEVTALLREYGAEDS